MTLLDSVNSLLQTVSTNSPVKNKPQTMDEVLLRTAESHLADESKIETLKALNDANDWKALQRDDREKVRQYEMAKLPWRKDSGSGKDDDEMQILGDVTIQQAPNKNPLTGFVIPLAAMGLMGYLAYKAFDTKQPAPVEQTQDDGLYDDIYNDVVPGFGKPWKVENGNNPNE